jgi:leucyl-tRNA synthetase
LEWSESGLEGAFRFLKRLWSQVSAHVASGAVESLDPAALNAEQRELRCKVHDTIAKVTDDISRRYTFNTAIAAVMELSNRLNRFTDSSPQGTAVLDEAWKAVVRLMGPVTPHICEVLWQELGETEALHKTAWPVVDESARVRTLVTLVVQVNGKLRARIEITPGADRDSVIEVAMQEVNVKRHLQDKTVRKMIHVPNRLLNIVVG